MHPNKPVPPCYSDYTWLGYFEKEAYSQAVDDYVDAIREFEALEQEKNNAEKYTRSGRNVDIWAAFS